MINDYFIECKRYLLNAYPYFVTSMFPRDLKEEIPIFIFHRTEKLTFEEKLIFLAENKYRTINLDKLYMFLTGASSIPPKSIMLTFDDGDSSIYYVAYPLLKKYNLHATAFICPAYIEEKPAQYDPNRKTWLSWEEIEQMHKSGLIDFQSHTLNHEKIFTHSHIKSFYKEGMFKDELGLDIPSIFDNGTYTRNFQSGVPIYTMHSRMEKYPRYFDSPSVRKKCIENQGKPFLNYKALKWIKESANETRFEDKTEQKQNILYNLIESKKIIEERLNKEIIHLAYPYGIGSELSIEYSKEAGYKTNLWGPIYGQKTTDRNTSLYEIPRIKDDFIFRLPGKGRRSLAHIFSCKWKRRQRSRDIY